MKTFFLAGGVGGGGGGGGGGGEGRLFKVKNWFLNADNTSEKAFFHFGYKLDTNSISI